MRVVVIFGPVSGWDNPQLGRNDAACGGITVRCLNHTLSQPLSFLPIVGSLNHTHCLAQPPHPYKLIGNHKLYTVFLSQALSSLPIGHIGMASGHLTTSSNTKLTNKWNTLLLDEREIVNSKYWTLFAKNFKIGKMSKNHWKPSKWVFIGKVSSRAFQWILMCWGFGDFWNFW